MIYTYFGENIEALSRDELIKALKECCDGMRNERKRHEGSLEIMRMSLSRRNHRTEIRGDNYHQ